MQLLFYKMKRSVRKRSTLLVSLFITLFLIANYTSLLEFAHLGSFGKTSTGGKTPTSKILVEEDATVPFYKAQEERLKKYQSNQQNSEKLENEKTNYLEKVRLLGLNEGDDKSGSRQLLGYDFFENVFNILKKGEPQIPKLDHYKTKDRIYHAGYDGDTSVVFTEEYLSSFIDVSKENVNHLKSLHSLVVNELPEVAPKRLYEGDGIVYVGGGKFNWLALLSIKSLRSLGSTLPVEVIIPTIDEYEVDLCSRIFPALNARCILLTHALGEKASSKFEFSGYQYKALALIVSSFENVLLIDADNIPVHAPDYLFKSEPFINTGLITWPDFWRRATSPDYYTIANIHVSKERVRFGYEDREKDKPEVPLHDRANAIPDPTSESGQLMISKSTHAKELFLALYYNLYGPDFYYPLFSQGSDGEGDKETFLAATVALNSTYYQVHKFLNAFGHFNMDHEFIGCGMGQYDPVEDYSIEQSKIRQANTEKELNQELPTTSKQPRILFVHANFPKLNPITLKEEGKIFEKNGERIRLYGPGMAKRVGYDFELVQWRNMQFLVCELKIEVQAFEGKDYKTVCEEIQAQLEYLEATVKDNERD